jgi:hypothetical protein
MATDGEIDFKAYTREQLDSAVTRIDRQRYPINAQNLVTEYQRRQFAYFLTSVLFFAMTAVAAPPAKVEDCGWLVPTGNALVSQPDALLKPRDPAPLSKPPPQAKAAYCDRDTMMSYVGDERVKLRRWWRVARLARAADPEGKTEIIVFYQEARQATSAKEAKGLFERLNSAIRSD